LARVNITNEFCKLQVGDATLTNSWSKHMAGSADFVLRESNKLLYYKQKNYQEQALKLVMPLEKSQQIIKLAHDSHWGGHFGKNKSFSRIMVEFWWPTLKLDIDAYVGACAACQKKARITKFDRVPISPVIKPTFSFETVSIDIIRPILPLLT